MVCLTWDHLLAHLKAPGRGLLMKSAWLSTEKRASVIYHQERKPSLSWNFESAYRAGVRARWENTDAPGFLANGGAVHRLLAIPTRTKVFPGFPRGKQGSKPACNRIPSCPKDVSEVRWKWDPGICIESKRPGELGAGSHIVAWPPFVCQNAQLPTWCSSCCLQVAPRALHPPPSLLQAAFGQRNTVLF